MFDQVSTQCSRGLGDERRPRSGTHFPTQSCNEQPESTSGPPVPVLLVFIIQLTVPWEGLDEANRRERAKQLKQGSEAGKSESVQLRWGATARLLWEAEVRGQAHTKAIKALANAAERSSQWLWLEANHEEHQQG